MKFEYDNEHYDRECVAYTHVMEDKGEYTLSLAIKTSLGKVVTFYHDGTIKAQSCYEHELGDCLRKKFYRGIGDKITITF